MNTSKVWFVSGDEEKTLFTTKMAAEMWARVLYPDEDPYRRYMRILYREVFDEEYVKPYRT